MSTDERKAIAVTGMPGSGKGTFCEEAASLGWKVVSFGDIGREVTKRESKKVEGAFAVHSVVDRLRKEIGLDWIAKEAAKLAQTLEGNVCFDDPRTIEEIDFLRSKFPDLKLIGLFARDENRYRRLLSRGRWDDKTTSLEEIKKKDLGGGAWGIPKLLELSDFRIENDGTLEELRVKSARVLSEV